MHVIIVGGGFGGIYTARWLLRYFKRKQNIKVTLINPTNYFTFIPMLHEVATGGLCGHHLTVPYRGMLRSRNFSFVKGTATFIDLRNKTVKTETGKLHYDYLVLATGSQPDYHGITGAQKNTLVLQNLRDAVRLKHHLIECIEQALATRSTSIQKKYCTIVLVGAGATGVELALEIEEFMGQLVEHAYVEKLQHRVILLQHDSHILHQFPALHSDVIGAIKSHKITLMLNTDVKEVADGRIITNKGAIDAATIIWTAGIKPYAPPTKPHAADSDGYLTVNQFLQLPAHPEVFAIGDCASYVPSGETSRMPALAQVASQEGKQVARNIFLLHQRKKPVPFTYKLRGILLSLGRRHGVALINGIRFRGFFAWWLMRTIYLFKIIGTANKLKTAYEWTLNLFMKRHMSQD